MAFSRSLLLGLLLLVGARTGLAQNTAASPVSPPSPNTATPSVASATPPASVSADAGLSGRLQKDIAALTAFPSRVPGTTGNMAASEYVLKRFKQIGLSQVKADEYSVTAPITHQKATLNLNGRDLEIFPVYPNQVVGSTTPEKGISGPLVYAGMGRPADYNGQKIEGSIVALDFNCGMNWITAADLGAKAIVFLAPEGTDRGQAERKFTVLPVELPRFYIQGADAQALKTATGQNVTLKSLVTWEPVATRNILGFLPGTAPPAKGKANTVILSAYFDSMSVVPDIAPGAEAAGNMAALLELAARLKKNPPSYNVLFVANGAHHIALAGVRNFLAMHAVDRDGTGGDDLKDEIATYRAFVGLDLTSRTTTIGMFAKGWFYNQMGTGSENILLNQFGPLAKAVGRFAAEQAKNKNQNPDEYFVDGITGKDGRTWRSYLPSQIALDAEAATLAQIPGISFATANDARLQQDTPFDTVQNMNLPNLAAQVNSVEPLLRDALTEVATGDAKSSPMLPDRSQLSGVFGFEVGRAIYQDVAKANSFLPDTPIPDEKLDPKKMKGVQAIGVAVSDRGGNPNEQKSYSGVRGLMIERVNYSKPVGDAPAVAQFVFTGPRVGDPKGGGTPGYEFEAFSINRDGHIIFAPDRGSNRQRFSPGFNKAQGSLTVKNKDANQLNADVSLICFSCRAATVFDTLDQRYFTVLREMSVLDAKTDAEPVVTGYLRPAAAGGISEIEPIGIVFSQPGQRFKLIMAQGLLGKRLVLLQSSGEATPGGTTTTPYEGTGFEVLDTAEPNRVNRIAYQTANDLWILDQQRVRLLKGFGINNERVDILHGEAGCPPNKKGGFDCPVESVAIPNGGSLANAKAALANFKYDTFYAEARRAFGLESRAYPDVEATSQDVLKGIIFYLALLLPFAYFMERMLFGFSDVRKQIVGTSLVFLGVFAAIRFVHPAFELAATPFIILLAFIILALTVIVTTFLQSKFEQEIKRLKQGVHYADMGRLSALGAAVGLGIANMRRRPTRTALTCVTLILLTFTVLSFTSVTANIQNYARPYGEPGRAPAYQGFLVRDAAWSALPDRSVDSITNEIRAKNLGEPALRAWYLSRDQGEPLQLRVQNVNDPSKFFYSPALLGMSPEEQAIGSPLTKTVIKGRWFQPGDTNVCLLPRDILLDDATRASERAQKQAEAGATTATTASSTEPAGPPLGLTLDNAVGSKIQVSGKTLEVVGVFDDRQWYGSQAKDNLRDIDNEEYTPVDYSNDQTKNSQSAQSQSSAQGNEVSVQRYEHMQANALLVLPYQTAMDMGATTRSIAVGIKDPKVAIDELEDLMNRAALGIFGATPDLKDGVPTGPPVARLYSSVEAASYEGFASLAIPILIAAMIIANTMLGSVYERTREIGIYSSIGLAPIHIAALFIAEAIVYAVLGSISGYLIAQITAKIITATNALPGITLNYSSSSAVLATLIVMATVLLSTLYPAWAASRLSQPDERKAELGEPMGDLWRLQFPFTVSGLQSLGMAQFLADYFESHTDTSVGKFYTDKVYFSALSLRDAVDLLNAGVPAPGSPEAKALASANGNGNGNGVMKKFPLKKMPKTDETASGGETIPPQNSPKGGYIELDSIAASPDTQVFLLHMRTWLAPFDMGVSQDTDIILLPSNEPGLYEMQLRLERRSGEIAAWKRVNREFMTELRKQLLVWRTVKPAMQHEYILRGRAHVSGQTIPTEEPGAVVA